MSARWPTARAAVNASTRAPAHAISMPLVYKKNGAGEMVAEISEPIDKAGA